MLFAQSPPIIIPSENRRNNLVLTLKQFCNFFKETLQNIQGCSKCQLYTGHLTSVYSLPAVFRTKMIMSGGESRCISETKNNWINLPETLIDVPASIIPLLGRTQYLRGAVVFTLKQTFFSVELPSFRFVVTTSVKGPKRQNKHNLEGFPNFT